MQKTNPGVTVVSIGLSGPVMDFERGFYDEWNRRYPKRFHLLPEERKSFLIKDDYPEEAHQDMLKLVMEESFFLALQPVPGAVEAVRQMEESGLCVIFHATVLPNVINIQEMHVWLREQFGNLHYLRHRYFGRLFPSNDKTLIPADILIDDNPSPDSGWFIPTWKHVLFDMPFNQNSPCQNRLSGWENWKEAVEKAIG